MIEHIDLHAVLRASLTGPYADLVTRPTGRAVRASIEQVLARDAAIARLDFTGVGLIDFSCADEIVAKLLRERVRVLLVRGLTAGHREALEPVLEAAGLAVLAEAPDGTLDAVGRTASAEPLYDELVTRQVATRRAGGAVTLTLAGRVARRPPGLSTRAIHGRPEPRPDGAPVAPPLTQSATFTNPVGSTDVIYTRYGNNPNQLAIGRRLALLEGAEAALFVGSGMGAIALAHLAVLRPGDHLVSSAWVYGGVHRLFSQEFGRLGIEVTFVQPPQARSWKRALRKNTRALFLETPTNPLMRVLDVDPLATMCKAEGLALLVDSTFATPVNFRPLEHGADVVIHSATKYLNGHSDVIAGAVAGSESLVEEVRRLMQVWGQALDPFAAWLIDRGLRTLAVRMERHNATGLTVAEWCTRQDRIAAVHYPGLPGHPDHDVATRILDGYGGMLGIELEGGGEAAERFLRALRIITHAPSLGGVETLVSEPRVTSHAALTPDQRAQAGIPDGFLRFSLGLEDADDLIADFAQALASI